jgi:RIO-like serine/threonine protein kinase
MNTELVRETVLKDFPNARFLLKLENTSRHEHIVYLSGSKKIIAKVFTTPESFEREKRVYALLSGEISIPRLYRADQGIIITDFIDSEERKDFKKAIEDWAKIHNLFLGNPVLDTPLLAWGPPRNIKEYVLSNPILFNKFGQKIVEKIEKPSNQKITTLIHSDLYERNILTTKTGNYYIDFEFSGRSHPGRELALMILNHPEKIREIIGTYKQNITFDYNGIEEDIKRETLIKSVQLIGRIEKVVKSSEERKRLHSRFISAIEKVLSQ